MLRRSLLPAAAVLAVIAGCASGPLREPPPRHPGEVRAQIESLLPATTPDRAGWSADIQAALAALQVEQSAENICAVLAVTEQESTFRADPAVPGLSRIAWEEIDRRAEGIGAPKFLVRAALQLASPNGKSYAERIDAVKTEKELSAIFEDFIGMVPLGQRLFGSLNPVRTGGPMQVSIAFAERHAKDKGYPYPVNGSIRHEVFTRRGGLYFGIAHLLDYPASYDRQVFRFADFNAGRYASRNAAFQNALTLVTGIPLALDGDLLPPAAGERIGTTELAARSLGARMRLDDGEIRRALEQGEGVQFERSELYRGVLELADRLERKRVPRAMIPRIALKGPKISRQLTTEWFASRVEARHKRCLARAAANGATAAG
jgi:hypothetical protein